MNAAFADRLMQRTAALGPLCIGYDPFADRIPSLFGNAADPETLVRFFNALTALAAPYAACVKLQIGLFEPYGSAGVSAAYATIATAQAAGLPVILDAKRGDIGTTADGYAAAAFGAPPAANADAVTVNPYMGLESLEPFFRMAERAGRGVAVLVRTSNVGAKDFQDLHVDGRPLWAHVAARLASIETRLMASCGWSNLMIVAGATAPEEARALRTILPKTLFLVPGYGAQGASAADAMAALPRGAGGVVNASRAALYPEGAAAAPTAAAWEARIVDGLARLQDELRAAGMTA